MISFTYTIKDKLGIHARPAGEFVKAAKAFESNVSIAKGGKSVDAKKIFGVMGLAAKQGDIVTVTVDGADEGEAAAALEEFMKKNL